MNHLISYAYLSAYKAHFAEINKLNILLDSGAFTAFKLNRDIDLQEYCAFVKNPPFKIWRYFSLDKIGDPEVTDRNLQIMLDKGLHPIPVYQRGQPIDKLYELIEKFNFVGIGGVAGTNDRNAYLKWILERSDIDAQKLHLLGVMNLDILRQYRPYSCDSSFIVDSTKFGQIVYFDPIKNKIGKIGREIVKNALLMKQLPVKIQEGLYTKDGWVHSYKAGGMYNYHLKASIIFADRLSQRLSTIGCKFFMIIPYQSFPTLINLMKEGLV
jgi:hypothetical protein